MRDKDPHSRARGASFSAPSAGAPALLGMPRFGLGQAPAAPSSDTPPVNAGQVLNVADFEALARAKLPPAHFGYLATGVDDDRTVFLNHEAYSHIEIRSRRFVDVSKLDTSRSILGNLWRQPFYFSAVSSMRAFHPEAEAAVARAAASRQIRMMASTGASCPVEEIMAARNAPIWQQLYATDDFHVTEAIVRRAEKAGCDAIALTVDVFTGRNTETLSRAMSRDGRTCTQCHIGNSHDTVRRAPMFAGIDVSHVTELSPSNMSGDYLDRLRKLVTVKLLVKGIVTAEDAKLAMNGGSRWGSWYPTTADEAKRSLRSDHRVPARNRRRGAWANSGVHRRRHPARHRHFQSTRVGGIRGRHRAASGLGARRLRPAGGRGDQRHFGSRASHHHAPGRDA